MGANVSDKKYFPLFRVLMEKVFEKAGYKEKFSLKNADAKFKDISEKLSQISPINYLKRGTIRNYVERYRGDKPFTAQKVKLDVLCTYINEQHWSVYVSKYFDDENDIIEENQYRKQKFTKIRKKISSYYKKHKHFNYISIIGDVDNKYPPLDISDFYVDLSYIKKETIKSSNSLLSKEKASYVTTLSKERLKVSEKLAETIISNHKRTVVLGNPGTGKSIFSRHLCYKWAKRKIISDDLFMHVSLKELDFKKKKLCIPEYIKNTYLHELFDSYKNHWSFSENTLFILDGFDEISNINKKVLFESLFHLVKDPKYLLLSRPYGILNQQISYSGLLEILGFNENTRLKYITTLLNKSQEKYSIESIFSSLDSNPQLSSLSFNPLMLSYLILVITNEGVDGLNSIRSVYDLQSKISGWLEFYYNTKEYEIQDYQNSIIKGEILAYEMELNQEYVCYRSSKNIKYDCITDILNETGIGRKESFENDASWRFYFNSATFQEFLAAKAVINTIQPEHIFELLKNQLYWNFTRMIIGGISNENEERVHEILGYLSIKYEEESNEFIFLLYTILLVETSEKIVQKKTDNRLITKIVTNLHSKYENKGWSKLIFDSTVKIYQKLSFKQSSIFINQYVEKLYKHYLEKTHYDFDLFINFVTTLKLYNDPRFIKVIFSLIEVLIQKYEIVITNIGMIYNETLDPKGFSFSQEEEEEKENILINIIGYTLEMIGKAPIEILKPHKSTLNLISANTLAFLGHTSVILDRMKPFEVIEKEVIDYLNVILAKLRHSYKNSDDIYMAFKSHSPYHISLKCLGLADAFKNDDLDKRNQIINLIFKGLNLSKKVANVMDYDLGVDIDNFLTSINQLKAKNYIENLIELVSEYNLSVAIEFDDQPSLNSFISSDLKKYKKDISNWNLFNKIFKVLGSVKQKLVLFYRYKNDFYDIVIALLEKYGENIEEIYLSHINKNHEEFLNHGAKQVIDKIINAPSYTHQRHSFFQQLIDSEYIKYKFVQNTIIFPLVRLGLSSTSKKVWGYVHQINEDATPKEILLLLDREDLYEYQSNYQEIIKVLNKFKNVIKTYEFNPLVYSSPVESIHYTFYRIGFYITKIFLTRKQIPKKEKELLLLLLSEILLNKSMVKMRYNDSYSYLDLGYFKLFLLNLYELTGNENIISELSLESLYNEENMDGDFELCQYALEIYGLEKLKNEYAEILGEELTEIIIKHYHEHIELFQSIDTSELLALVSSK